jgi:hypothetical protein
MIGKRKIAGTDFAFPKEQESVSRDRSQKNHTMLNDIGLLRMERSASLNARGMKTKIKGRIEPIDRDVRVKTCHGKLNHFQERTRSDGVNKLQISGRPTS